MVTDDEFIGNCHKALCCWLFIKSIDYYIRYFDINKYW